jgi:long-chain acyl-CoA synthetase
VNGVDATAVAVEPAPCQFERGELVFRGPNLPLGYVNAPAATAEALRGGWYHSGDVAHVDAQGFVYIVA